MNFLRRLITPREDIPPKLKLPRSPEWSKLRNQFLKEFPQCNACGSKKYLEVHHIIPVHLNPSLELQEHNLITLCESKGFNCHFFHGHSLSWVAYNPNVIDDSKLMTERIKNRLYS